MRGKSSVSMGLALGAGLCASVSPASAAQYAAPQYAAPAESPATTLDRCIRTLATSPTDFPSLICAGKAAVAGGDPDAAAGFFARADEVNPRSPLPQAGMGAVAVANGDARAAMPYFTRALQLGANVPLIGADRGLAFDLMGLQPQAQADYRAALTGPDRDEARRRLALSLAISGDRAGALQTLLPLAAADPATSRTRAFVLALTGDPAAAMVATNAAMPGSSASAGPFLQRLATLQPAQKAAAVNLGIFPDSGGAALASIAPQRSYAVPPAYAQQRQPSAAPTGDRLASIDDLLRVPAPPPPAAMPVAQMPVAQAPVPQIAYNLPTVRSQPAPAVRAAAAAPRIWLQLASGPNPTAFADEFRRLKSRGPEVFEGIRGYVASSRDRSRLLIGPFSSSDDARTFAEDLSDLSITAFSWTNSPSDTIVPLNDAS